MLSIMQVGCDEYFHAPEPKQPISIQRKIVVRNIAVALPPQDTF